jgi:hypothetical protein
VAVASNQTLPVLRCDFERSIGLPVDAVVGDHTGYA